MIDASKASLEVIQDIIEWASHSQQGDIKLIIGGTDDEPDYHIFKIWGTGPAWLATFAGREEADEYISFLEQR